MTDRSDRELERLLALGRLSGPERERIFEGSIAGAGLESRPRRPLFARMVAPVAALALVAGAAVVLFWVQSSPGEGSDDPGYRSKGAATAPLIEIGCRHGDTVVPDRCHIGELLLIRVDNTPDPMQLFARAIGASGDTIVYFPDERGEAPVVDAATGPVLVDRAVVVDARHRPGRYRLVVELRSLASTGVDPLPPPLARQELTFEVAP